MRAHGSLSGAISIAVPRGSSPLQAYVTPDHRVLISSEETGVVRAFRIGRDGSLTEGPDSPLWLAARVFPCALTRVRSKPSRSTPRDNPWNFAIDPTGHVIFLLDMRAVRQIPAGEGNQIHALQIAADGRLSDERSSPIRIPVPVGTNPIGLAILGAR